jgi:hypothetical protein
VLVLGNRLCRKVDFQGLKEGTLSKFLHLVSIGEIAMKRKVAGKTIILNKSAIKAAKAAIGKDARGGRERKLQLDWVGRGVLGLRDS